MTALFLLSRSSIRNVSSVSHLVFATQKWVLGDILTGLQTYPSRNPVWLLFLWQDTKTLTLSKPTFQTDTAYREISGAFGSKPVPCLFSPIAWAINCILSNDCNWQKQNPNTPFQISKESCSHLLGIFFWVLSFSFSFSLGQNVCFLFFSFLQRRSWLLHWFATSCMTSN